jgi:hypothetical protein
LVSNEVANRISEAALNRLRAAAADGSLALHRRVRGLLFRWEKIGDQGEVRQWTDTQFANDAFVINFAERSISHTWSQGLGMFGMGDTVASRRDYVNLEPFAHVLDLPRFRLRVQELLAEQGLAEEDRRKLERFVALPERNPEHD